VLCDAGAADEVRDVLSATGSDLPIITAALPHLAGGTDLEGVFSYLVKPIDPDMIATIMHDLNRDGQQTILLIDDEPDAVRLLRDMLTAIPHDYRILEACDGEEALETMRHTRPDIVFVDLLMPGMDGRQVIEEMRREPGLRKTRIVVISAMDWREEPATVTAPLRVDWSGGIELTQWARCVQGLLETLKPRRARAPVPSARSAPVPSHSPASAEPPPRPWPAPDAAG
jgi:CheY-like chemotaxis protein